MITVGRVIQQDVKSSSSGPMGWVDVLIATDYQICKILEYFHGHLLK